MRKKQVEPRQVAVVHCTMCSCLVSIRSYLPLCVSIRPPEYHPQQVLPCHRHRLSCHRALCLKAMMINFAMGTKYYFLHCASILQLPTTSFCSSSSNATFSCIVLEAAYVWLLPMGGQHKVDYTQ